MQKLLTQSFNSFDWKKEFFAWKSWLNKKEKVLDKQKKLWYNTKAFAVQKQKAEQSSAKQVDNWITKQPRTFNSIEISGPEASDVGEKDPWKRTKFEPKQQ